MNIIGKKSILTLTTAAALGVGAMGTAQAGSLAVSVLEVQNFLIQEQLGESGNFQTLNAGDFASLLGNNTGDVFAFLQSTGPTSDTIDVALDQGIDLGVCQGSNCLPFGPNDFSITTPPPTGNYVVSDNLLQGAAINFPGGPPTDGADASTRGDVSLLDEDAGSAQTNLGLNTTFNFALNGNQSRQIRFIFDYNTYLGAFVSNDLDTDSDASASSNWTVTVREAGNNAPPLFTWSPTDLNSTVSTTGPGDESFTASGTAFSSADPGQPGLLTLNPGVNYSITIRHTSLADASVGPAAVPEPTSIALLGGGLVGLAAMRRRAKKTA